MSNKEHTPSEYDVITITCDRCKKPQTVKVTSANQSQEDDSRDLVAAGWRVTADFSNPHVYADVCPACCKALEAALVKPEKQLDMFDNDQPWLGD